MNKFDVQLILGYLKVDGKLIFNESDLTIDTFKTTYVIKYTNIKEYYFSNSSFCVRTDSKEYVFDTNKVDAIRKILDEKIKPEKEIVIDGEEDANTKETKVAGLSEHLLFYDSNKYGTYNLYNSHLVVDYHEGHTKYDNLIIKYNDIDDLDFHATSDPEYMFLYIVTNDGETYDFYFNKDKVDECRKVLEPRVMVEKEVIEDGAEDNTKSNINNSKQSIGASTLSIGATFIFGGIMFFVINGGSFIGNLNVSGCYYRIDSLFDEIDKNNSLCFNGNNVTFKHNSNSYKLERKWFNNNFSIINEYGDSMFSCDVNRNDTSKIKCTSFNDALGREITIWQK